MSSDRQTTIPVSVRGRRSHSLLENDPNQGPPVETEEYEPKQWHRGSLDQPFRDPVIQQIFAILSAKFPEKSEASIMTTTTKFDKHIYHTAESLSEYSDLSTLKRRLFVYALSKRKGDAPCASCGSATVPDGQSQHGRLCSAGSHCPGASRCPAELIAEQQQRILVMRHATRCNFSTSCCGVRNCSATKEVWEHVVSCRDADCAVPDCLVTRNVIKHYTACINTQCPLCAPVKEVIRRHQIREVIVRRSCTATGMLSYSNRKASLDVSRRRGEHLLPACAKPSGGVKRQRRRESVKLPVKWRCVGNTSEGIDADAEEMAQYLSRRLSMKGYIFGQPTDLLKEDEDDED